VPVLAPARGGPLDLVHPDDNGWLWPAGEPAVLREQVRALADDPARLATMLTCSRFLTGNNVDLGVDLHVSRALVSETLLYQAQAPWPFVQFTGVPG